MLVISEVTEGIRDHKSEIRRILRDSYPAQFTVMRKIGRFTLKMPSGVSEYFHNESMFQHFEGGKSMQHNN